MTCGSVCSLERTKTESACLVAEDGANGRGKAANNSKLKEQYYVLEVL